MQTAGLGLNRVRSRYRAEQYDPDLGLYYLRARYMNPVTGRFLSRDPEDGKTVDPKTLHRYLYAGGDQINALDPTGRDLVENVVLIARAIYESRELVNAAAACVAALAIDGHVLNQLVQGHEVGTDVKIGAYGASVICAAAAGPLILKELFL